MIRKHFRRDSITDNERIWNIQKDLQLHKKDDLQLHNVYIASYYTDKYALWLDFRTIYDNKLHGLGR